jgi:hypothetical protein
MRIARRHKLEIHLAFEQLEPRAMLAGGSALSSTPQILGTGQTSAAAVMHSASVKSAAAAIKAAVTSTLLRGDINLDGQVNVVDLITFLHALTDLGAYQQANNLSDSQFLAVADVNKDGIVNNADLQALIDLLKSENTPPPPTTPKFVPLVLPAPNSNPLSAVVPANSATSGPPIVQHYVVAVAGGAFDPLQSTAALLGGGGGDASAPPSVANNGPPMPAPSKNNDIALIAFASRQSSGGGEQVKNMLMKLADVEEPQLLGIEYGDEVVKREVTVNKKVIPTPPAEQPAIAPIAKVVAPVAEVVAEIAEHNYWWLLAIPAGAAVAASAWWVNRQRLQGNVGILLRRLRL